MKRMVVGVLLLIVAALPAEAFTCDQVRWAVRTFPTSLIEHYKKNMSAEQIAQARRCLEPKAPQHKRVNKRRHRRHK